MGSRQRSGSGPTIIKLWEKSVHDTYKQIFLVPITIIKVGFEIGN